MIFIQPINTWSILILIMNKVILALLIVTLTNCIFEGDSAVISLTTDTHDQVKEGIWFMDYYASWCGHCQQMAPEY